MKKTPRIKAAISAAPVNIQAVAGMIEEAGKRLIEEYHKPINIMYMERAQLMRLINGTISQCLNPECENTISLDEHFENFLKFTCSEKCTERAIFLAAKTGIETLQKEIPELEIQVRENIKQNSGNEVGKGDVVDRSTVRVGSVNSEILKMKQQRLAGLIRVIREIEQGTFDMDCAGSNCGEEKPLPAVLGSPEIKFCPSCLENGKRK